jgi:hypothetical protein
MNTVDTANSSNVSKAYDAAAAAAAAAADIMMMI